MFNPNKVSIISSSEKLKSQPRKRSLLEKYDIPINHLDFDYIKSCTNAKEIERIFIILKSNEEGYYPDLMKSAEDRLKLLNPQSKALREEEPMLTRHSIVDSEWKKLSNEFDAWANEIKEKDKNLRDKLSIPIINSDVNDGGADGDGKNNNLTKLPPIRQFNKNIKNEKPTTDDNKADQRIRSCDYNQWDKYDADTEMLKMDLDLERNQENVLIKNKKNSQKPLIEDISNDVELNNLSNIEREQFGNVYRIKGNDFFKVQDYRDAINEYTKSISFWKTAMAYNNRAMAYLKLNENDKAISDCNECLQIDDGNLKALLRKAQALCNKSFFNEAFGVYKKILEVEPQNQIAKIKVDELRKLLPDLPPDTAFRMKIQDDDGKKSDKLNIPIKNNDNNVKKSVIKKNLSKNKIEDEDFSKLIIPKKIVPSKLAQMASCFDKSKKNIQNNEKSTTMEKKSTCPQSTQKLAKPLVKNKDSELIIPTSGKSTVYSNGVIIEEL